MAALTQSEITSQKALWVAALAALSKGQSYDIGNRRLTRADLAEVRNTLDWLAEQERELAGTAGPQFTTGRPRR